MVLLPLPDPSLVLTFVNTRTRDEDHLDTPDSATSWAMAIPGLARLDLALADADLHQLRKLREELGHLFDEMGAESIATVNDLLGGVQLDCRLDAAGGATYSISVNAGHAASAVARMVLGSLVQLAEGPGLASVRQCSASDCSIRFSSRNVRRIWCDTSTCGNRERARRHYRRRSAADEVLSPKKKP